MIYYLISLLVDNFKETPFRLFEYVTFRGALALGTAFLICLIFGNPVVVLLKKLGATAPSRLKGVLPEQFVDASKDKIPSMGGALIVVAITISTLLWCKLDNFLVLIFLVSLLLFSLLGFWDDRTKIISKTLHQIDPVKYPKPDGISGKAKFAGQFIISVLALTGIYFVPGMNKIFTNIYVPFLKEPLWSITQNSDSQVAFQSIFLDNAHIFSGSNACIWWWIGMITAFIFGIFVVTGTSNAVNLTDGKDGLAVGCTIFCVLTYGAFAYVSGHRIFADYLNINYIAGASEILIFTLAIAGACIGFLWHNCYPASMFMGDTGSLALGGVIGLIAILVKQEILLILVGGVFFVEIVSVMIQVTSFKLFKRRVFKCTPIHHHFEMLGWKETQIVVRFWILAGLLAMLGLATLKLR